MNRYRLAWTFMSLWWLWLGASAVGTVLYFAGPRPAIAFAVIVAAAVAVSAIIVGWGEAMHWLDNKAREHGRRASASGVHQQGRDA